MHTRQYNLHGLVCLRVRSPDSRVLRMFDAELGRFHEPALREPNIDIIVDRFRVMDESAYVTEETYAFGDTIYGSGHHKIARWRFALENLDGPTTRLVFSGGPFSLGFLQHRYVEPLIRYKLALRDYTLVHGCCLAREGRSVLMPGLMHTGKTSIALDMVRRRWQFQSDDYTIVGTGRTHSYPRRLHFSSHLKERYPGGLRSIQRHHAIELQAKQMVHWLTFGYGSLSQALAIDEVVPQVEIVDQAWLDHLILLTTHTGTRLEGPIEITPDAAVDRVLAINWREAEQFWQLLLEARCMNVGATIDVWGAQRGILARSFQGVRCHELRIPRGIDNFQALLPQIHDHIEQISSLSSSRSSAVAEPELRIEVQSAEFAGTEK